MKKILSLISIIFIILAFGLVRIQTMKMEVRRPTPLKVRLLPMRLKTS